MCNQACNVTVLICFWKAPALCFVVYHNLQLKLQHSVRQKNIFQPTLEVFSAEDWIHSLLSNDN